MVSTSMRKFVSLGFWQKHVIFLLVLLCVFSACSGDHSDNSDPNAPNPTPDPSPEPVASTGPPIALFSDLISGPDTGLGDGLGSGVIVTVWGQSLGSAQGDSTIEFCDSVAECRAGHVYYWKNADGQLPGGPANLYESHGMQEVAFSIPDSASGAGQILVTVDGETTTLPFTVRPGNVYHVKSTGNDDSGNGSWNAPWATVAEADAIADAGDTLYIHNVITGHAMETRAIYNNKGFEATYANQFAYVCYPNTRAEVYGADGFHVYITKGVVTSKLSVFASNCDAQGDNCFTDATTGIQPSDFGRVIGNKITDQPNGCANSMSGAISGGIERISGAKIFGNFIHDYSCPEATKFHHTTYFTVRDVLYDEPRDETVEAFELGWNYLKDNEAKNGLHTYDEDLHNASGDRCGDVIGDLRIHDNVVINQAGAGLEYKINCGWSNDTYIYNNIFINTGLPSDIHCASNCGPLGTPMHVGGGLLYGNIHIFNNIMHTWDAQSMPGVSNECIMLSGYGEGATELIYFNDNICYTPYDKPFFGTGYRSEEMAANISGTHNVFFYSGVNPPAQAIEPDWDSASITLDPMLTVSGSRISVDARSPVVNQSQTDLPRDIYGNLRGATSNIGAVQ